MSFLLPTIDGILFDAEGNIEVLVDEILENKVIFEKIDQIVQFDGQKEEEAKDSIINVMNDYYALAKANAKGKV